MAIAAAGAIPPLVKLTSKSSSEQEEAAGTLMNLAACDANKAKIMGAGAVSVQRFHPSGAGSGVGPGPAGGYQWAVTFVGDNVGGNVDMLVAAEVQNLVATNPNMAIVEATAGNQLQGAFTLRAWDGSAASTGHLDYYISDSDLETQLESLDSIGDVTVTRSTLGTKGPQVRSYQWTITFESNIHSGTDSALTWASPPAGAAGISRSWGPNVGNIPNMACQTTVLTTSHQPSISSVTCPAFDGEQQIGRAHV